MVLISYGTKFSPIYSFLTNLFYLILGYCMRPDYPRKPFTDQRGRYIFLMVSLATGSVKPFQ
jgi:hypothetical protein